jgi:hypothetical protein
MNKHSDCVILVLGITPYMTALLDNRALRTQLTRETLSKDKTGEPGANDEKAFGHDDLFMLPPMTVE